MGFPGGLDDKESACNAGDLGSIQIMRKIPWRREWLPTPIFLPGEFHEQRSLVSYSPWHHKESDMTEKLTLIWIKHMDYFLQTRTSLRLPSLSS